jgi:hypothetical protein
MGADGDRWDTSTSCSAPSHRWVSGSPATTEMGRGLVRSVEHALNMHRIRPYWTSSMRQRDREMTKADSRWKSERGHKAGVLSDVIEDIATVTEREHDTGRGSVVWHALDQWSSYKGSALRQCFSWWCDMRQAEVLVCHALDHFRRQTWRCVVSQHLFPSRFSRFLWTQEEKHCWHDRRIKRLRDTTLSAVISRPRSTKGRKVNPSSSSSCWKEQRLSSRKDQAC